MRQFFSHNKNTPLPLRITVEEPMARTIAPHHYTIDGFDTSNNRAARASGFIPRHRETVIIFEDEDNPFKTPTGVSVDAVLAVLIDHLDAKQGMSIRRFSPEARALDKLREARDLLDTADSASGGFDFENLSRGRRNSAF